ncbi:hypothetical protein HU830_05380 [Lactobacillus sp. DCY120]|uniref:Uncharacterized protein n=1 Tax=Bombilactobacillus apium TaxID=2675299 RepID=A0A850R7F0_9LACO|nr:hypothetical protein [Bombilactobacillus apium]NVY96592.1 hypothetical protein [Bombilactobacillus apium]
MSKKLGFGGYFLLVLLLFYLVPTIVPQISVHDHASLVLGYQNSPFLIAMIAVFSFFFDYLSLVLPQSELLAIRTSLLVRRPSLWRLYRGYGRFLLPYLLSFMIVKGVSLFLWPQTITVFWFSLYLLEWLCWLALNLNRRVTLPNGLILLMFGLTRILAHYLF